MLRKRSRTFSLMCILSVAALFIGLLWIGAANVMGADCEHKVYCDDRTTCIICGKEDLEEAEISEVVHPYAYCFDLTTCGACGETIAEGSAEVVRHSFEEQAKYYPEGDRHIAECFCGEESEIQMHIVKCTQVDLCILCNGDASYEQKNVMHEDEHLYQDKNYHWKKCLTCNKLTTPMLEHYTDCTDPDGPCGFCGRDHDECDFAEGFVGMHKVVHEVVGEGEARHHMASCIACENVIEEHEGLIYNDFGSDEDHGISCAECGQWFDDEPHEYKNGVCTLCGHKQESDPKPVTGDESHIIGWILIIAGALSCMVFCVMRFRKKKI